MFWCQRHGVRKTRRMGELCRQSGKYWVAWEAQIGPGQLKPDAAKPTSKLPRPSEGHGPGTELTKLFRPIRPFVRKGCKCEEHAAEMDRNGCDWCEANLDTIVGWLEQEAAASHLVFSRPMAEKLVTWAIRRARRKERKAAKAAGVV